jgi:5-methylcytosine-specific restriction protein A
MTRKEFYRSTLWKQKRIEILKRDHGICQMCKKSARGYKLKSGEYSQPPIDHIIELNDFNFTLEFALDDSNLQTLCHECHNIKTFGVNKHINDGLEIDFSRREAHVEIDLSKLDKYLS